MVPGNGPQTTDHGPIRITDNGPVMFAALNLERDPLRLGDIVRGTAGWVQDVGGFAAIMLLGLLLWSLSKRGGLSRWLWGDREAREEEARRPVPSWVPGLFTLLLYGTAIGYLVVGLLRAPELFAGAKSNVLAALAGYRDLALTVAGACALGALGLPFLVNLTRLRWRRIGGIARLSFKEAVRGKVIYVFSALLLLILFRGWFVQSKPESQLSTDVVLVYGFLAPLMLVSAALVAAFGIPTDIKRQTIHTVVTKPVERFEIILGRFLGYTVLMTLVLLVLTTLSLGFVLRGVNPEAAAESLKARVPLYGELDFLKITDAYSNQERGASMKPDNVGREWNYHKYIPGEDPNREKTFPYAVWTLSDVPGSLAGRKKVRCEFKFDIYRTTKGQENRGVFCSFFFHTRNCDPASNTAKAYRDARPPLMERGQLTADEVDRLFGNRVTAEEKTRLTQERMSPEDAENFLTEKFGFYEIQSKSVADYHTMEVDVPAGLFRNALTGPSDVPPLTVRVRCESPSQLIGMARYDLYFREDNPEGGTDTLAFALNFYKGSMGLWMSMCLVIGLCVFLSTELSGIITFLCVMFLYLGGWARDFIHDLALKQNPGGGPLESAYRLMARQSIAAPLEDTTFYRVASGSDEVFRWVIRRFLNVLPDVERFSFTDRVSNGFDVAVVGQDLLPTLLMLAGYLLPWALLAFYMLKSREIAGAH
jgi:hypothetical protein